MRCMGEHIHWLDSHHTIGCVEVLKVACLSGWVATHIHDTLGGSPQDGLHHIGVHTSTWGIGDDHIGASVLSDEVVGQDVLHITSIEKGVLDAVQLRVDLGVLDGLRHILDTDHLARLLCHEVGNGACSRIEVIHQLLSCEPSEIASNAIEMISLLGVRLIEALGTYLELQILHRLKDMILALEHQDLLIADGVVALLIVELHQRRDLREGVGDMLQQSESLLFTTRLVVVELEDHHPLASSRVADDDIAQQTHLSP